MIYSFPAQGVTLTENFSLTKFAYKRNSSEARSVSTTATRIIPHDMGVTRKGLMNLRGQTIPAACASAAILLMASAAVLAVDTFPDPHCILWRFKTGREILG